VGSAQKVRNFVVSKPQGAPPVSQMQTRLSYSIVVLTFDRHHLLERLLDELQTLSKDGVQVIVVDNASSVPAQTVTCTYANVIVIRAPRNLGAAGRNLGFQAASGDIIISLDDDVSGLKRDALTRLDELFADEGVGAVNFSIVEDGSGRIVNWVHHRTVEQFAESTFETYEITEGAVALRRTVLEQTGGYPESFFLSHEGPDLAFRIMNLGSKVIYSPAVQVTHSFDQHGRLPWRNYYYDTRNTFWLAARNLPLSYAIRVVTRQTIAMLLYSLRDGYLKWWWLAVWHGLLGLQAAARERTVLSRAAMQKVHEIDSFRPGLIYMVRRRRSKKASMRL